MKNKLFYMKQNLFPLFCFIVMQILAVCLFPYNKTYICESFYNRANMLSSIFTLVIYNIFVFTVYIILFCLYITGFKYNKKQIFKIYLFLFIWMIITEIIKTIFYFQNFNYGLLILFIIDIIYILGINIIILYLSWDKVISKKELSLHINIIFFLINFILNILASILLYYFINKTRSISSEMNEFKQLYISSFKFDVYFKLLIITVLIQTLFFAFINYKFHVQNYDIHSFTLSIFIVLFAIGIGGLKILFPNGMISDLNGGNSYLKSSNNGLFNIDISNFSIARSNNNGEKYIVYHLEKLTLFNATKKIGSVKNYYPINLNIEQTFDIGDIKVIAIKNYLVAFIDENYQLHFIFADMKNNELKDNKIIEILKTLKSQYDYEWCEYPFYCYAH